MTNEEFESVPRRCYRMGYLQCLEDLEKFMQSKKVNEKHEAVLVWDSEFQEWMKTRQEELNTPEEDSDE